MEYTQAEILQTVRMTEMEHLDVRTVTLGLSLRDCVRATVEETADCVREKIERTAARLVSSMSLATTRAGVNMDAVRRTGEIIKEMAERTRERGGIACAKFVCFANSVEDNPFMAGAVPRGGGPPAGPQPRGSPP